MLEIYLGFDFEIVQQFDRDFGLESDLKFDQEFDFGQSDVVFYEFNRI